MHVHPPELHLHIRHTCYESLIILWPEQCKLALHTVPQHSFAYCLRKSAAGYLCMLILHSHTDVYRLCPFQRPGRVSLCNSGSCASNIHPVPTTLHLVSTLCTNPCNIHTFPLLSTLSPVHAALTTAPAPYCKVACMQVWREQQRSCSNLRFMHERRTSCKTQDRCMCHNRRMTAKE